MWDSALTNNVAMQTLAVVYPHVFDVACFSHTLDHVGSNFNSPILLKFINSWISLFSHSLTAYLERENRKGKELLQRYQVVV